MNKIEETNKKVNLKSTRFVSAEEKNAVLRNWQRFIKNDFRKNYFTKRLYEHLHLHCSFIAHFDIHGFYGTYFENPEDTIKFLQQFDGDYGCKSVEYGTDYWINSKDYKDINSAIVNAFEPYKSDIYRDLRQKTREMKLKQIEQLRAEIENLN